MGCVNLCVWLMFYIQSMLNGSNAHVPGVHKLASFYACVHRPRIQLAVENLWRHPPHESVANILRIFWDLGTSLEHISRSMCPTSNPVFNFFVTTWAILTIFHARAPILPPPGEFFNPPISLTVLCRVK